MASRIQSNLWKRRKYRFICVHQSRSLLALIANKARHLEYPILPIYPHLSWLLILLVVWSKTINWQVFKDRLNWYQEPCWHWSRCRHTIISFQCHGWSICRSKYKHSYVLQNRYWCIFLIDLDLHWRSIYTMYSRLFLIPRQWNDIHMSSKSR